MTNNQLLSLVIQKFSLTFLDPEMNAIASDYFMDLGGCELMAHHVRYGRLVHELLHDASKQICRPGSSGGFGDGRGVGYGRGGSSGHGDGSGDGRGADIGNGCGDGRGNGNGNGYGEGRGRGDGRGYGGDRLEHDFENVLVLEP